MTNTSIQQSFFGESTILFRRNFGLANIWLRIQTLSWAPVTHACNPSYLGGTDQEDGSQPKQIVPESLSQKTLS
jgi:hypothetical protein